ncbi:MAG: nonribosomal peptide synthetase MxaA [Methylococcaceae bacterium]
MRVLLLVLLLTGCSGSNTDPVSTLKLETPRPFGYLIGDEIPFKVMIETDVGVTLQAASIPATGQVNRWLNLNQVQLQQRELHGRWHYELELRYQVFYAPLEVKLLTIPSFTLQLLQNGKEISQIVPAWAFNISPLRELSIRKTANGEYKRPDALPLLLSTTTPWTGVVIALCVAVVSGFYLAALYGLLPRIFKRHVFRRASQQLTKLSKADMDQALFCVHYAFNTLNQRPLFHTQVHDFYRRYPDYKQMHEQVDWFFNYSNRYFFSNGMIAVTLDVDKLKQLCEQARKIEQGSP